MRNEPTMRNLWMATRSLMAVLAGIVVLTALAFAVEIPLRELTLWLLPRTFPDPASLDSSVGWMLSLSVYTVPALVLGGYVAAWLAPRHGLAHAVAMATVQDLLIVALIFDPPHPVPAWIWAIGLLVTPAAIISGGLLRVRHETTTPTNGPASGIASDTR